MKKKNERKKEIIYLTMMEGRKEMFYLWLYGKEQLR